VHIEHLAAFHFRNLDRFELDLEPRSIVLRGANGQGKTNVLETLYVCATGRSFRNAVPRDMLRHDEERGWIRGRFVRHGVRHDLEVQLQARRRWIRIDGRSLRQTSKLLETVNVVAFFPDDLRIAKGGPDERRRFLDRAVANYRPEFVDASLAYARALKSRNALLRSDQPPRRDLLEIYDEQLILHGEVMHRCRVDGLASLEPLAVNRFAGIMPDTPLFGLALDSGVPGESGESFGGTFQRALREGYPRDRARRMTTVGPHRGDLLLSLGSKPARVFASQGQQRAMVLALKLAELETLTERLGTPPILLLDDVSSELDAQRTRLLFETLGRSDSQIWLSTTGAADLPIAEDAQVFEVHAGRLTRT
jgi:DNA replication and repair protein RecF